MDAADAGLDIVGTVAQLAGTAASHLSTANVGGIIKMIVKLAQTARRNKKECKQLAGRVQMMLDLLPYLQGLEEKATRAPLEALAATLLEALEVVKSCQSGSLVGRVFRTNLQASKLADVQGKIDFYLLLFPMISHIAISAALDRLRIESAASRIPTSVPPPASLLMGNIGGIMKMIVKLAQTARRNKRECVLLADRVGMILDLLPYVRVPEKKATPVGLEKLAATLQEALEIVKSCQGGGMVGWVFTSNVHASKLTDVQIKIDSYILVFNLISYIATIAAIDRRIPIGKAASQSSSSVPPPSAASRPAEAGKDGITWVEVAAASTVTMVSHDKATGTGVYIARLQDGRHAAIKSFIGNGAAFRAELSVVSSLRHQHIVRLLCWHEGDGHHLLVYEYVGNSTLRDHLRRGGECSSWIARMEVLLAAARAIEHLHRHDIVHGNVSSCNFLVDEISGKLCVSGFSASVVDTVGSSTGRLESAADDVRGFGVVMLEALTGREPVVSIWKEEKKGEVDVTLETFALPSIEAGKLGDVLDIRPAAKPTPRQLKALKLVADMAARCVSRPSSSTPRKRPTMSDVVAHLKEAHELISTDDTNKLAVAVVCFCFALSLYRGSLSFSLLWLAGLLILGVSAS